MSARRSLRRAFVIYGGPKTIVYGPRVTKRFSRFEIEAICWAMHRHLQGSEESLGWEIVVLPYHDRARQDRSLAEWPDGTIGIVREDCPDVSDEDFARLSAAIDDAYAHIVTERLGEAFEMYRARNN